MTRDSLRTAGRPTFRSVAPVRDPRLTDGHAAARRLHPSSGGIAPSRPGPMLYISGVPEHRALLSRLARRWQPTRLLVAAGGRAGLRLSAERRLALVVVDAQLPDADAVDVVAELREHEGPPVVVLGHDAGPREHARFVWAGAGAYITRPINLAHLDRVVHLLLRSPNPV